MVGVTGKWIWSGSTSDPVVSHFAVSLFRVTNDGVVTREADVVQLIKSAAVCDCTKMLFAWNDNDFNDDNLKRISIYFKSASLEYFKGGKVPRERRRKSFPPSSSRTWLSCYVRNYAMTFLLQHKMKLFQSSDIGRERNWKIYICKSHWSRQTNDDDLLRHEFARVGSWKLGTPARTFGGTRWWLWSSRNVHWLQIDSLHSLARSQLCLYSSSSQARTGGSVWTAMRLSVMV